MAVNEDELMSGLTKDAAQAQDTSNSSQKRRGVMAEEDPTFKTRSKRIGAGTMSAREIAESKRTIDKVVDELTFTTSFADKLEQEKFSSGLRKKLNDLRMLSIKHGLEVEKSLNERQMDQQGRQALIKGISGLAGGITEGVVANGGRGQAIGQQAQQGIDSGQQMGGQQGFYGTLA